MAVTNKQYMFLFLWIQLPLFLWGQTKAIEINSHVSRTDYATNRYAFIVGNDHYTYPSISSLTSCRLDAQRIAGYLQSVRGFQLSEVKTKVLLDAKKNEFVTAFTNFLKQITAPEQSTLYFYYSGHGLSGSLVPTDFRKEDANSLIAYDWIINEIDKHGIAAKVYMIDACYAGSILDAKNGESFNEKFIKSFENTDDKTVAFTATTAFRVTPAGRHQSLFTKYFLKALKNAETDTNLDTIISAGELFAALEKAIGVSNAPQFLGAENFPMGTLVTIDTGKRNIKKPFRDLEHIPAGSQNIVSWRRYVEQNKEDSIFITTLIKELETENTPLAQAKLGFLYHKGVGVLVNERKALTYLIPAAFEQNSFAQYNLGYMYSKGIEFASNKEKAFAYFTMAANNGDPFAQHNLGSHYYQLSKNNIDGNIEKALFWYLKAAGQLVPESQTALGNIYGSLADKSTSKNEKAQYESLALSYHKKAAEQKFAYGQYQLAKFYKNTSTNTEANSYATYWLKEACNNNYLRACSLLLDKID